MQSLYKQKLLHSQQQMNSTSLIYVCIWFGKCFVCVYVCGCYSHTSYKRISFDLCHIISKLFVVIIWKIWLYYMYVGMYVQWWNVSTKNSVECL